MLIGEEQIEILQELMQEKNIGFRRAASMPIGTAVTSPCAMCQVALSRAVACSALAPPRALVAAVSAQSCKFLNSPISKKI